MSKYNGIRFYKPFGIGAAFHFYLLQAVASLYMIYRLISRDYSHLGLFSAENRLFGRGLFHELFPVPPSYLSSFQFIYEIIPFPSPYIISIFQGIIIISAIFLLLGLFPKIASIVCVAIYIHLLGIMQSIDAEIDGGTILVILFLILSLSPKDYFYKINKFNYKRKQLNWPIFMLFLLVGAFYSLAGLNKIIDVGFGFPFSLDLEKWNEYATEKSMFLTSRNYKPLITSSTLFMNKIFSDFSGLINIITELGFISILWLPRYRFIIITSMIFMHITVFNTHAINFLGSSFILLLCFDWNILIRELNLIYDDNCGFCKKSLKKVKKFDLFNRINLIPSYATEKYPNEMKKTRLDLEMGAVDENNEIFYGADAFEQVFSRVPLFWPIAILMKIPGVIYLARLCYKTIAKNRNKLSNEECEV